MNDRAETQNAPEVARAANGQRAMLQTRPTLLAALAESEEGPELDQAWDRFHALYAPLLRYWLRGCGVPEGDVEDLCQEIMIILIRRLPRWRYDPARGRFRGYVKTIATNKARRHLKQRGRRPHGAGGTTHQAIVSQKGEAPDPPPDDAFEHAWQRRAFEVACGRVRSVVEETHWTVFEQVVVLGRPATEVAQEHGMKRGNVYVICSRIRAKLRASIAELDG